jgi:hypothetical protein
MKVRTILCLPQATAPLRYLSYPTESSAKL